MVDNSDLGSGSILDGKYRLVEKVGEGGMGTVWKATHVEIGRTVAIKLLHMIHGNSEIAIDRFRREAKMAGSIGHDNICEVTDLGTTENGSPYLVMPLLKGRALVDLIDGPQLLPVSAIVSITLQTLSALQAAHEAKIVHRDLKPDNIFLTKFGEQTNVVKLLDFGICKLMDDDPVSSLTQSGTILGTPYYMAPEQAKGNKGIDHKVDIYAMGVILYEMLTGGPPFTGDSYNEIMFKIVDAEFISPRTHNPLVPPDIETIVLRAMSRDPGERYVSADHMRDALKLATNSPLVNAVEGLSVSTGSYDSVPIMDSSEGRPSAITPVVGRPISIDSSIRDAGTVEMNTAEIRLPKHHKLRIIAFAVLIAAAIAGVLVAISGRDSGGTQNDGITVPLQPNKLEEKAPTVTLPQPDKDTSPAKAEKPDTKEATATVIPEPTPEASSPKPAPSKRRNNKASRKTRKPTSPPKKETPKVAKPKGEVKGRFGTKIVSDYED